MRASPARPDHLCAHCRYNVRGLPTLICPECGSDLSKVGVCLESLGRRMPLASWLVAWAILLLVVAFPITDRLRHQVGWYERTVS
jgi:predicted amidophosphoribosyltransferase